MVVLYGCYGLFYTRQRKNARSPVLLYYGLIGIGVCSGGYHMTLKYHTQMCMCSTITIPPSHQQIFTAYMPCNSNPFHTNTYTL
jgi:hypothetical protein